MFNKANRKCLTPTRELLLHVDSSLRNEHSAPFLTLVPFSPRACYAA